MSNEVWYKWQPHKKIVSYYDLISTIDTTSSLIFHLDNNENNYIEIALSFQHSSIEAYRQVDESCRLLSLKKLEKDQPSLFDKRWTFFTIDNSFFMKELSIKNQPTNPNQNFIHFSIITDDFIIDIISKNYPKIEISNEKIK